MPNNYFQFKQFTVRQDRSAMKVTTDSCLFGAFLSQELGVGSQELKARKVLDIGTGTGLLALMLAQKNSAALIDAIEIDKDAFEQATENVAASPWVNKIKVIHADARAFSFTQQYDVIISNPPFYENELKSDDKKKNIAHHGDDLALPELLSIIKKNLSREGRFYLLLPYKRNEEIKKLIIQHELFIQQMVFVKQSDRHDYFRIILSGKAGTGDSGETAIDEKMIWDGNQQYTGAFINLLKDYYLYL